ncbi:PEP/pyruvate-binding domain-containing protein [Pseudarthrobacter sp. P1]|uniref:PEP/pyruvate-binding domain-containing protein n=1 Tax=Pseudarthrobacter sp. P1 TaxID=3418418 RepID=UPI003CF16CAB
MAYINNFDTVGSNDAALVGGKAANLGELARAGLPVPAGFVLGTSAYADFVEANSLAADIAALAAVPSGAAPQAYGTASAGIAALFGRGVLPPAIAAELSAAYQQLCRDAGGGGDLAVAVRSSATAEDLTLASFAGQQDTFLNVRGDAAVAAAVVACWASLWTARAMAYRDREGVDAATVRLAVVVQAMVEADAAGVLFTANPANGRRNEIMVSAAWGLGESVVGGSVSTDDVVLAAGTGRVLSRRTAEKTVMTVYAREGTREQPVPLPKRWQPVLDDVAAAALARCGEAIQAHFGVPQDVEWARAGGEFFIVQSRPITALPEPVGEVPSQWPVPYPQGMYFRASIVEQLPDPLTPLFADLIDPSVTRSLNGLLAQAFGTSALHDGDLGLPTINGYAYYYYRTAGFWRLIGKSLGAVGKLARGQSGMGLAGWRDISHPHYVARLAGWAGKPLADLPGRELLAGASELLDAGTAYYTAVQSVIPVAASSEIAFRTFYDKMVRRAGDPSAATFLLGYDSEPIRAEKSLYDLAAWTRAQPGLAAALLAAPAADLARAVLAGEGLAGAEPAGGELAGAEQEWAQRFRTHLQRYGHAVYNLDFANPLPADEPSALLETLKFYLRGLGKDPYQRQQASADRREEHTRVILTRLDPVRGKTFGRLLRWAQRAAPVREDALADIGLAWPLIRRMLLELGRRLVASGVVAEPADVFWLHRREVESAIGFGLAGPDAAAAGDRARVAISGAQRPAMADDVEQRKMLWRGQRRATAPQLLPENRWMERMFGSMMPAGSQNQQGETITGVGTSAGQVVAAARVLGGPEDFSLMQAGEVLVARMTTPAWTSLFAMAAGVVTDVGGPLSHSSIVAREYGIPAVLGTGVATQRLASGQRIRVDGDAGTVRVEHDDGGRPPAAPPGQAEDA